MDAAPRLQRRRCIGLAVLSHPTTPDADLGQRYRRAAIPVALVDGATLDAPAPGWMLTSVQHPLDIRGVPAPLASSSARAGVTWQVRGSSVRLDMVAQPAGTTTACPYAELGRVCDRLGTTPFGAPVTGGRALGNSSREYESVWVDVDGGRWRLAPEGSSRTLDVKEVVQVLSRLQPVDIDRYLAVTGR